MSGSRTVLIVPGGGFAAFGVGAVVGAFGMVQSFQSIDHGKSHSSALGVGIFGCTLSVAGDLALLIGIPMWICAAVQRHRALPD